MKEMVHLDRDCSHHSSTLWHASTILAITIDSIGIIATLLAMMKSPFLAIVNMMAILVGMMTILMFNGINISINVLQSRC